MSIRVLALLALIMTFITPIHAEDLQDPAKQAQEFILSHVERIRPLENAVRLAWWNANISGDDDDFKKSEQVQNKLDAALAGREQFAKVKALKEARISDPLLARQIDVLYRMYLEKQVDLELLKKMVAKSTAVEQAFNKYRAEVDGRKMTDSEVRKVLKESKSSEERRKVWEASKGVGTAVEADLKQLVKLRNEAARELGFKNYHQMQLYLSEQSQEQVLKLFDELDKLTREPFRVAKQEIDTKLAQQCGIEPKDLRPWHYHDPFFQEAPAVFGNQLDEVYSNADILKLCEEFYAGIGLPIDDVIERSDLYEKSGKSPHAFCTDIDREGNVRVLANIVPNEYWMGTMLHELGHAVYSSKYIPESVPYVLRTDAHTLATEGVAMLFERYSKSADWLQAMGVKVADPKGFNQTGALLERNALLIFSRWCQVMLRFEKELYENPDQDLNKLWLDLVEEYQMVKRPEGRDAPDYASKIHVVTAPVYYHNYMMGELFASQVFDAMQRGALKGSQSPRADSVGNPRIGEFFKRRVFAPGRTLSWNDLTKFATGSELNAKAFADDFKQ